MEMIKILGVCGLACEVCSWPEKGLCPTGGGCVAGTDPKASEKLEKFKAAMDHPCAFLECAIENKIDTAADAVNSLATFIIMQSYTVKNSSTWLKVCKKKVDNLAGFSPNYIFYN